MTNLELLSLKVRPKSEQGKKAEPKGKPQSQASEQPKVSKATNATHQRRCEPYQPRRNEFAYFYERTHDEKIISTHHTCAF